MVKAAGQMQFVVAPTTNQAINMITGDSIRCQPGRATFCGLPNVGAAMIKGRCLAKNVALNAAEKIARDDGHPHA